MKLDIFLISSTTAISSYLSKILVNEQTLHGANWQLKHVVDQVRSERSAKNREKRNNDRIIGGDPVTDDTSWVWVLLFFVFLKMSELAIKP